MAFRWVFVGGTGRSGTTVVARGLANDTPLRLIPTELRFHVDAGGLLDLANGEVTTSSVRERLLGPWFERRTKMGVRGIHRYIDRDVLADVVDRAIGSSDGPREAAARIWRDVLSAMFGEARVVEMTPPVAIHADDLGRLLPGDAAFLNVVRDGRDVAHSVARMRWGPDDVHAALHWWAHRIRQADKARRFCAVEPLIVPFEDLADRDRRAALASRIALHVGGIDAADVLTGLAEFETTQAHIGTWRASASHGHIAAVDALYERLWQELQGEGVEGLPPLVQDSDR